MKKHKYTVVFVRKTGAPSLIALTKTSVNVKAVDNMDAAKRANKKLSKKFPKSNNVYWCKWYRVNEIILRV